jgi:hypothetical protein
VSRLGSNPDSKRFIPRTTLVVGGAFALFFALSLLYALPVLLAPVPAGATPDYLAERVRARLDGTVPWFLGVSMIVAAAAGARWMRR